MKVAIIHDWLVAYAGGERVLEQLLVLFPDADIYTLVDFIPEESRAFLGNHRIYTSFIQKMPFARKKYRQYLPLMPLAIEQFDLSRYEMIISSSHAVAKGVLCGPDQVHFCYCHTPIRYAWDFQHQYLRESGLDKGMKGWLARYMLHKIRLWDARTANGVDQFIANSNFISRRIWKTYRRESTVIHPPVDVDKYIFSAHKQDFYVTSSRMVPYKRIDVIVEAFSMMPEKRLIVIGDGPEFEKTKRKAGPNVTLLGFQPDDVLRDHLQKARAYVFAAEEDFGISPIEAQACGTPVIAYGKGGALETIRGLGLTDCPSGVFYNEQTAEAIIGAVEVFEDNAHSIEPSFCRENALRFSNERFRKEMATFIQRYIN